MQQESMRAACMMAIDKRNESIRCEWKTYSTMKRQRSSEDNIIYYHRWRIDNINVIETPRSQAIWTHIHELAPVFLSFASHVGLYIYILAIITIINAG